MHGWRLVIFFPEYNNSVKISLVHRIIYYKIFLEYQSLYHSSCPNRTVQECDKFEENNLSHCKNISWFSMFLFHEFFMVLCSYWVKLLQITDKLDSYCGIKSISHVDLCDKWRNVWYGLLSHTSSLITLVHRAIYTII